MDIPILLQNQSSNTGHHFWLCVSDWSIFFRQWVPNMVHAYTYMHYYIRKHYIHTWYSAGVAFFTIGRRNLSVNFFENSLIVKAKAIVLANSMVRTANTLIHTFRIQKQSIQYSNKVWISQWSNHVWSFSVWYNNCRGSVILGHRYSLIKEVWGSFSWSQQSKWKPFTDYT